MAEEYYADWEWKPIDMMPDGCQRVSIVNTQEEVAEMCSCDYWWLSEEDKSGFTVFRSNE
jgi:hypothetical protein